MATAEALFPFKRSYSYKFIPPDMSELRVVLLGNSWIQRSLVGNLLLNKAAFDPEIEPQCSETASGPLENKTITVINTPKLLHPDITEDRLKDAIEFACLSKSSPHVFLLVLQPEDFTEQQQLKLQSIIEKFREQPFDHSMVLVKTDTEKSLSAGYVNNHFIQNMIIKCRYRYMCLKNFEEQEIMLKNFKIAELLARLGQIVKENEGDCLRFDTKETINPVDIIQTALSEQYRDFTNLRILLIGQSEDKKESLRSFITGGESHGSRRRRTQPTVVKTPDLFSMSVGEVRAAIKRCVAECSPGPNVLLLLVKPSDFTETHRKTLNFILMLFGPRAFNHCIIAFTDQEQKTDSVFKLLRDCQCRSYEMHDENLSLLIEIIKLVMQHNFGSHVNLIQRREERYFHSSGFRPSLKSRAPGPTESTALQRSHFRYFPSLSKKEMKLPPDQLFPESTKTSKQRGRPFSDPLESNTSAESEQLMRLIHKKESLKHLEELQRNINREMPK